MNKARVQSDAFQAAEIKLEELCKASGVIYKTFDLYESRDETNRRRVRLRTQIRRFVFFSCVKIKKCACSHNITPLYLSPLIAYFGRSCVVCSKLNNRIFDSEKEWKAHTSAE